MIREHFRRGNAGLIYVWRSQVREGLMPGVAITDAGVSAFSAVAISRDAAPDVQSLPPPSPTPMPTSKSCRAQSFWAQSLGVKSCDKSHHSGTIEIRSLTAARSRLMRASRPLCSRGLIAALDGGDA